MPAIFATALGRLFEAYFPRFLEAQGTRFHFPNAKAIRSCHVAQLILVETITFNPLVLPLTLALATGVAVLGSLGPVRQAIRVNPAVTLCNAADKWRVKIGDDIVLRYREAQQNFHVTGILNTGGAEDDQIFVSLDAAQALTNHPGLVSLVQISPLGTQTPIEETARALEQAIPDVQAKTVRQIAEGEVALIRRVQLLLALIAAIVLVATGVSVGATMTTVMLERRREIGLMKAIGAEARRIGTMFLAEVMAQGVVGGIAGYALKFA